VTSRRLLIPLILVLILVSLLAGCGTQPQAVVSPPAASATEPALEHAEAEHNPAESADIPNPDYTFTLETATSGGFIYLGDNGETNPELRVPAGATVAVTVVNGDGIEHDLTIDVLGLHSDHVVTKGESSTVAFRAETPGRYAYYCTLPGHRQAGMEGVLLVEAG
jgi:nitrite reductase (NO-forming)